MNASRRFAVAPTLAALFIASVFGFVARTVVSAQSETKKQPFDEEEASPTPKPKKKKTPTPSPSPKARKSPKPQEEESASPSPKKKKRGAAHADGAGSPSSRSPKPSATENGTRSSALQEKHAKATPPEKNPEATSPPPRAIAVPTSPPPRALPVPTISASLPPEQITIEKSGFEEDQGYEPPPPPPPRRSFWARLFGARDVPGSSRYLSRGVVDAIRRAPVQRGRWKFIIVHNSGTRQGNARAFDYYHRHVRRMKNGLAYHFVIGNGTSSGNGQIEVGNRWHRQINGGHVHSDYLNNISLGICLVGDFNRDEPTRAQLDACDELIRYLRQRCGRADGREIPVRPHREMNPPQWATDCPGDVFPYGWFRRF